MGVPRVALGWGACDPKNPKNRRRRCSLLVEQIAPGKGVTRVLVDTSPDLREQLIDAQVDDLDGVLITHEHADHTHGIDDLRALFVKNRRRVPVYMDATTAKSMRIKFNYCFETQPGTGYPPTLEDRRLVAGQKIVVSGQGGDLAVLPVLQDHGEIASLGFRFGNLAYSADIKSLPPESLAALAGLDLWIVDALRYAPHPSHLNVDEALAIIGKVQPQRTILTNLHADLDYEELRSKLPAGVEPAFDGMSANLKFYL